MSLSGVRVRFVPLVLGLLVLALVLGWALREGSNGNPPSSSSPTRTYEKRATTSAASSDSGLRTIAYADLPSGARTTLKLVDAGGPYPFRQDGTVYQNRNKVLPLQARGYYHEYTVVTPGQGDRGPRRIVVGDDKSAYYTADHYNTFRRVLR